MFRKIDDWLNNITMYKLLQLGLISLVAVSAILNIFFDFGVSSVGIVASFFLLSFVCYVSNLLLGSVFKAPTNAESSVITALILVCILPPPTTLNRTLAIAAAGLIAMVSKYIFAIKKAHIFNPAALAAFAVSTFSILPVTWWIVSPAMLPFTLFLGLLIIRKIRRIEMFFVFALTSCLVMLTVNPGDQVTAQVLKNLVLSWPLIFFGTIMLTEPSTTPAGRYYRNLYAGLVGVVFASQLSIGAFDTSPEFALLAGNLFAFAVMPKKKTLLMLKAKRELAPNIIGFEFNLPSKLSYLPGQYLEMTLDQKEIDFRGNRRTFTIASSPTEDKLQFGIKFYKPSSTFKKHLSEIKEGDQIIAGNISGDFVLPKNPSIPLVFIAGGIGITPFRSMVKYLLDTNQKRSIELLYLVNSPKEAAYKDLFEEASEIGMNIHISTKSPSKDSLAEYIHRDQKQQFYISGPPGMVRTYKNLLKQSGVKNRAIKTDYFAGY